MQEQTDLVELCTIHCGTRLFRWWKLRRDACKLHGNTLSLFLVSCSGEGRTVTKWCDDKKKKRSWNAHRWKNGSKTSSAGTQEGPKKKEKRYNSVDGKPTYPQYLAARCCSVPARARLFCLLPYACLFCTIVYTIVISGSFFTRYIDDGVGDDEMDGFSKLWLRWC